MKWRDLLEGLKKVSDKYLDLKIIIGGNGDYYHFDGFDLVGPETVKTYSGRELIDMLSKLKPAVLSKTIPLSSLDEVVEETLFGDLPYLTIGPLRSRCVFVEDEDYVTPLEDYVDETPDQEIDRLVAKSFPGIKISLLKPYDRLVIMTKDGDLIVDDSESVFINK